MTSACARGPFERLGRVRELGGLVAGLLEEPCAARFGLAHLGRGVAVRARQDVLGLGPRRVRDLGALPFGLPANARDLGLLLFQVHLCLANLLLGALDLLRRGLLRVALDGVRELGRRPDEMERIHAHRVATRLGDAAAGSSLENAEVRLERGHVAAKGIERLLDALAVKPVRRARKVLDPQKRRQAGFLRASWFLRRTSGRFSPQLKRLEAV